MDASLQVALEEFGLFALVPSKESLIVLRNFIRDDNNKRQDDYNRGDITERSKLWESETEEVAVLNTFFPYTHVSPFILQIKASIETPAL